MSNKTLTISNLINSFEETDSPSTSTLTNGTKNEWYKPQPTIQEQTIQATNKE